MNKIYVLFTVLAIFLTNIVIGQTQTFTISGSDPFPISEAPIHAYSVMSHRTAYLFPEGQFATGNLPYGALMSSIAFERRAGDTALTGGVCKIYMENKPASYTDFGDDDMIWATVIPAATLLYNGDPANIIGNTPGYKTFPFGTGAGTSSSFTYTGGSIAIYIETSYPAISNNAVHWHADYPSGWTLKNFRESVSYTAGSLPSTLSSAGIPQPNTRFEYTNAACSAPPVAGTAVVDKLSDVCMGAPLTISLTGNGYGAGQTYQLQSATTSGGTYTNVGAPSSTPIRTFPATTTLWYRYAVTCGTQTSYSTPVLLNVAALLPAGTYTINKAQPTGGTNFQSFTDAVAAITCGTAGPVIFNVAANSGPYNEHVTIPHILTASATSTITFNGNNDTLKFAGTASIPHTLGLNGADYLRFNNLNVVGTDSTNALTVHLWNEANNNSFINCNLFASPNSSADNQCPFVINGDSNTVENCNIMYGATGIAFYGDYLKTNLGNKAINCNVKDFRSYGIICSENADVIISGNNIERPTRTAFGFAGFTGIYVTWGCSNVLIEKNRIHDPFAANTASTAEARGISLFAADGSPGHESKVYNNVIYNMRSNGDIKAIFFSLCSYLNVYHNSVSLDYDNATKGNVYGIYSYSQFFIELKNNNVSIVRGGTGKKHGIYLGSDELISDYNNFYINCPAGVNGVGEDLSTGTLTTLADWQAYAKKDLKSFSANPGFINASTGNLKPTSPVLDNKGIGVGVITDILGMARDASVPDIGAYEYGAQPCAAVDTIYISNVQYDSATIKWPAVPGAGHYEYIVDQVRTNPSGTPARTTDTSHLVTPLLAGTKYYVHVRTICITEDSSRWIVDSFTTPCVPIKTTVFAHPSLKVCYGDTVTLHVNATTGATYQWYKNGTAINGATDTIYKTGATGNYELFIRTTSLCQATSANNAVKVNILSAPVIAPNGNTLSTGTYASYQWNKAGQPIAGATSQTYIITETGVSYTVTVIDSNGCMGTSAAYIPPAGIELIRKEAISIYPNPASDVIYVISPVMVKVAVCSVDGKTLLQQNNSNPVNIGTLAAGIYMIKVTDMQDALITIEKVIKIQH